MCLFHGSLFDGLNSKFGGLARCSLRNTVHLCAHSCTCSQLAPCWYFTHGLVPIYQNPTLVILCFPKLASSSHSLTHSRMQALILTCILYLNKVYFKMNHFLSYRVVLSSLPIYLTMLGPLRVCWKARTPNLGVGVETRAQPRLWLHQQALDNQQLEAKLPTHVYT